MGPFEVQMSTIDGRTRHASQLVSLDIGGHVCTTTLG